MRISAKDTFKLVRYDLPVDTTLDIWLVDGESIRDTVNVDFIGGGHHYVYDFVPENDVWIDIDTGEVDLIYYVIHELAERALMKRGMDYSHAHGRANRVESLVRSEPEQIVELLQQLVARNE